MGIFSIFAKSPQKYEEKGDRYFEAEKFGPAKLEYESAINSIEKRHPHETDLKERLVRKLRDSKESLAREHLENGRKLVEAGVTDEAMTLLRLALSLTETPELKEQLTEQLSLVGESAAEERVASIPEAVEERYQNDSSDDNETFEILCAALPVETADAFHSYGSLFQQGYIALSRGDFAEAAELLEQAIEENPSDTSLIPVELATAQIHLGETDKAILLLETFLENNPSSFYGRTVLFDIFCELKDFERAHDLIDGAPGGLKTSVEGRLMKGRVFHLEGDYANAEPLYRELLATTERNPDIARELAVTLAASGRKDEARELYAELLNKCTGCGQRPLPMDQKAFADLSFDLKDFSDKTVSLYLNLANDFEQIRSDCLSKVSVMYRENGNEKEASRFHKLAEASR